MDGRLNSLTDVLKKTLYFFEALTIHELVPYVHQKMLKDHGTDEVEEKTKLCLTQNPSFYKDNYKLWRLNLEGKRVNDQFYSFLLKQKKFMSIKEFTRRNNKKKKKKKAISEEANLISDGRFIQHDNGNWGLTEWEVETSHYSLKHLIIKAMKLHPGGLSTAQTCTIVQDWRNTTLEAVEGTLKQFPYFEQVGEGVWCYNQSAKVLYDDLLRNYLENLEKQKDLWLKDRENLLRSYNNLRVQLKEARVAHKEAAAALAEKVDLSNHYDTLVSKISEKNLLLSLRKKEILRYREQISRLDAKANSILHQCRLWVKRSRDSDREIVKLRESFGKNRENLKSLFNKLQQYKERDRENKSKIIELKEWHSMRVAELQTEIIELKQRLNKGKDHARHEEQILQEEIHMLSNDLREALENNDELQKSLGLAQRELETLEYQKECLKERLDKPAVKFVLKLMSIFGSSV